MTPEKMFRLEMRSSPVGAFVHGRLFARRGDAEAVVGVFGFTREEYEMFALVAEVCGIAITDATGETISA